MKAVQTDLFKKLCELYPPHEVLMGIMSGRVFDLNGKKVAVKKFNDSLCYIVEVEING